MDESNINYMDEFNFNENDMSTSVKQLRNKKSEQNEETIAYKDIRMKLYDDIINRDISTDIDTIKPNITKKNNNKKPIKINNQKNKNFYKNILFFSLIFFGVHNYDFNNFLINQKFSYYSIVFLKLVLFLALFYLYKYLMN